MKKLLLSLFVVAVSTNINAQVKTPAPSPSSKLEQQVGLTDVTLEYSRPGMRGRTIFGDLVPYGKVWRTGANKNTTISFSDDVMVDGQELKAGDYAIFTKPNKDSWEVYFYNDTNNWGTPQKWDDAKVTAKTTVKVAKLPFNVETFMILVTNIKNNGASLELVWENVMVEVPFTVPTDKKTVASIEKVMAGASAGDYFSAARYYLEEGKDINKAKTWIDMAIDKTKEQPRFWYLRQQSLIYAKAGDKKGAIKIANESLVLAEKAGNADYVKMNKESIAKWSK